MLIEATDCHAQAERLAPLPPHATPRALGKLMLESDPAAARIPFDDSRRLVDVALDDGEAMARMAAARWGSDPERIAKQLGVAVSDGWEDAGYGTTVVYAEYGRKPARIVLYPAALHRLERQLARSPLGDLSSVSALRSVYLSHELYHHLDLERGEEAIARRERVTLGKFCGLRWMSGIAALAEIAAGSFAQHLLDLKFHPKLLDLLMLCEASPRAAARMAAALESSAEDQR
jgi:hypothetical protein